MEAVLRFHMLTKHHAHKYAPGPGMLDWANQPNPFREFTNSKRIILEEEKPVGKFQFRQLFDESPKQAAAEMNLTSVSKMFQHSLAVSCLKRYANGYMTALRINPSSGNLHPTEAYLVAPSGVVHENCAVVAHYNVQHHELEIRKRLAKEDIAGGGGVIYVGFSSIPWREAWKYGERAFRYCQLDMGHALASLEISCKMLGWQTRIVSADCEKIRQALGLPKGEEPECLVEIRTAAATTQPLSLLDKFVNVPVEPDSEANQLSETEIEWPGISEVIEATSIGAECELPLRRHDNVSYSFLEDDAKYGMRDLTKLCHQRRSALEYDCTRAMPLKDFLSFLTREIPFQTLSAVFEPEVHFAIFVHNVQDLAPGLYLYVRNAEHQQELESLLTSQQKGKKWEQAVRGVNLYCLQLGNAQRVAKLLSCNQDIAAHSCFSLGMLTRFQQHIPWEYKRLYWECGMLGQHLYLTAELLGARGTGIGCFLDDEMHKILGLNSLHYQSLYHFTVGYAVHDSRLVET